MTRPHDGPAQPNGIADILATGFGTTAAMWAIGYVCRFPGAPAPSGLLLPLLLGCLVAGGFVAGAFGGRGVRGGLYVGLLAGVLNLLILGSLLGGDQPNRITLTALAWIPASVLLAVLLAGAGAALGTRWRRPELQLASPPNWRAAFALVAAGTTLLLLAVGGAVTGYDYGLAVVDWPNTDGFNMFLYPLARMTGGIYYEHTHRLIGSLVGLTTLVLALYLQFTEKRRWLKACAWAVLGLAIAQGILGGLRVTGRFTLSTSPADTSPSITLAIVHGIVGQIFFTCLLGLASFLTVPWMRPRARVATPRAGTDRLLSIVLVILLIGQLILGALVRHLTWAVAQLHEATPEEATRLIARGTAALHAHLTVAVLVTLAAVGLGVRAWGIYRDLPVYRRLGTALLALLGLQLILGLLALLASGSDSPTHPPGALGVLLTTAHQTVGALLLALAALLVLGSFRLLAPAARRPDNPDMA